MQRITPFLWFDDQAEAAANFYVSVFRNSKIKEVTHYTGEESVGEKGGVMTVVFELDGQEFVALNGGPRFKFTEAVSLVVNCESQEEIDEFWAKLSDGGEEGPCGWLKDKFGVSWQIIPSLLMAEVTRDPDVEKAQRAMKAVLGMGKIDIAEVQRAIDQG